MYYYRSTPEGPSDSIIPCHPMAVCAVAPSDRSRRRQRVVMPAARLLKHHNTMAPSIMVHGATAQHRHGKMVLEGPSGIKKGAVETPPTPPDARRRRVLPPDRAGAHGDLGMPPRAPASKALADWVNSRVTQYARARPPICHDDDYSRI